MKIAIALLTLLLVKNALGALTKKPLHVRGSCHDDQYGKGGKLASPNFPHGHYPPRSKCNYTVSVADGYVIKFDFVYMDMEDGPIQKLGSCFADYLTITEINTEESSLVGGQRFCGADTPFKPVFTETNRAYIWFRSDDTLNFEGFVLKWKAVKPPEESFDCDFESKEGLCLGWKEMQILKKGIWTVGHGKTRSSRNRWVTGPRNDHTKKNKDGAYIFTEASSMRPGDVVSLLSPPAKVTRSERYCLTFWYHMYGSGIGALAVFEAQEDKSSIARRGNIVFKKQGEQGPNWVKGQVTINRRSRPLRFIFEVTRGKNYRGDFAIDDITITENRCVGPK